MTFNYFISCLLRSGYRAAVHDTAGKIFYNGFILVKVYEDNTDKLGVGGIVVCVERTNELLAVTDDLHISYANAAILGYTELSNILFGEPEKIIPKLYVKQVEQSLDALEG